MKNPFKILSEVVRSAFQKPATFLYQDLPTHDKTGYRGCQVLSVDKCIGCGLCYRDCPAAAIEMIEIETVKRP